LSEGVIGKAAREQQTQRVADVTAPAWEAIYLSLVPETRSELAVPLLHSERLVGVFNAESPKRRAFGLADQALLESLAQQAVIAYQTLERYQTHQPLREINRLLTSSHDPEEVIQLLLRHACTFLHADWGNLRLYDAAGNPTLDYTMGGSATQQSPSIQVTDWRQVIDLQRVKPEVWVREGLVAGVARKREPYLSKGDVQKDPEFRNVPGLDTHSEMAVPLLVENKLVGVLNLESERVNAFDVEDLARLLDFAAPAAVAVRDAQDAEESQQARERFKALKEVGEQIINAPLDEEKILEIVLKAGLERTGAFYAVAWQLDHEGKKLEARLVQSIKQCANLHPPILLGEKPEDQVALNGQVAIERRPILIEDIDNLPEGIKYRPSNTDEKSTLVVPLGFGGEYYGTIDFRHKEKGGFKAAEIELIKGLAVQAASGIKRVSEHTELQKAYAKLALADHQKFEFLAIASHELRQPLTHVSHILEQTLAGEYGEFTEGVLRHRLTLAHDEARHLVNLVQRLMNVARLEANADVEKPEISPCDVIGLIRTSIQTIQPEAQRYGISVKLEALPPTALIADLDSVKIKETLDNLLDNAVKYNKPDGSISVACFTQDCEIELRVSDTGRGIPPDKLDRIFEWFYQVDSSRPPSIRTRSIEGLGIGLYIVRANVKLHKGRIAVVSEVGKGSTFSVFLPMKYNEQTEYIPQCH
jgi:signal transduction histidine kinase